MSPVASFDEQQADVIREALRELLIDRASHLETALSDPGPDARGLLQATMDAGAAVQAAGWDGPLRLSLDAHLPVLREALRRLAVDMRGVDAHRERLAACRRLLAEIGGA